MWHNPPPRDIRQQWNHCQCRRGRHPWNSLSSGPPRSLPLHPTHTGVSQRIPSQAATADSVARAGGGPIAPRHHHPPVHRSHHRRRAGGRGKDRAKVPSLLYLVALNPLAPPPPLSLSPSPSREREGGDTQPQGAIVASNSLPASRKKNKGGNQPHQGAIIALNPLLPLLLLSYSSSLKAKNQPPPTKSLSGGGSTLCPTQNQQKLTSPFPSSSSHPPLSQGHPPGTYPCDFNARIMTNLESE
jgi:hypothetical protein